MKIEMTDIGRRYIIITPVKNEEDYIEKTITSIKNQTLQPYQWIIVDDGSTDQTRAIVENHRKEYDRIIMISLKNRVEKRRRGGGVVEVFYYGYDLIKNEKFDYLVKLDGDLQLPEDFFEKIINKFEMDPILGIASGVSYIQKRGKWARERAARGYTYGETKVYRTECFNDIGGLMPTMGWDGIDHIKAVMNGWNANSYEDIKFYHLRPEGTGSGLIKAAYEEGVCCHYMGYHPLFFILRSCKRMLYYPVFIGGLAMIFSYLKCKFIREKRIDDDTFISFLRRNQIKRIISRNPEYVSMEN